MAQRKAKLEWLPLDVAAEYFGYTHKESFRQRLRQLRKRGYVVDIGKPPVGYSTGNTVAKGKVIIMWPNPKTALVRSDAPDHLLDPKRGKRTRVIIAPRR